MDRNFKIARYFHGMVKNMNRYDWITWFISLSFSAEARDAAKAKVAELESALMDNRTKRDIVLNILVPAGKGLIVGLAKALIVLWLEQLRAKADAR